MRENPPFKGVSPLTRRPWLGGIEVLEPRALLSADAACPTDAAAPVTTTVVAKPHVVRQHRNDSAAETGAANVATLNLDELAQKYHPRSPEWNAALGGHKRKGKPSVSTNKPIKVVPHDIHRGPTGSTGNTGSSSGSNGSTGSTPPVTESTHFTHLQQMSDATFAGPMSRPTEAVLASSTELVSSPGGHIADNLGLPVFAPMKTLMIPAAAGSVSPLLQLGSDRFSLFGSASQSTDAFSPLPTYSAPGRTALKPHVARPNDWLAILPQSAYRFADDDLFNNAAILMLSVTSTLLVTGLVLQAIHAHRQRKAATVTRNQMHSMFCLQPV